mgnify:CR=1 FL=1
MASNAPTRTQILDKLRAMAENTSLSDTQRFKAIRILLKEDKENTKQKLIDTYNSESEKSIDAAAMLLKIIENKLKCVILIML